MREGMVIVDGEPRFTLSYLEGLSTLSVAQSGDLKVEDQVMGIRVWLERDPGNPIVIHEVRDDLGHWHFVREYRAAEEGE